MRDTAFNEEVEGQINFRLFDSLLYGENADLLTVKAIGTYLYLPLDFKWLMTMS